MKVKLQIPDPDDYHRVTWQEFDSSQLLPRIGDHVDVDDIERQVRAVLWKPGGDDPHILVILAR